MSAYTITLASLEHICELAAIEKAAAQLFSRSDLSEDLRTRTTSAREFSEAQAAGRLWVLLAPSMRPVGFALVQVVGGNAHLTEMDVHPLHGRKGLGSLLLARVVEWARSQRFRALTLTTFSHVPWNAPFYERAGFRVLSPDELGPRLAEILEAEASRGLRHRVAMGLDLRPV